MSKDNGLILREDESIATDTDVKSESDEIQNKMIVLLQTAAFSMQTQNVPAVDMAVGTATALYEMSKQRVSTDQSFLLGMLKNMISLFDPLTRAIVFQMEGRFSRALEEAEKGLSRVNESLLAIEDYAQQSNSDENEVRNFKSIFSLFPILFRGAAAAMRAEIVGYQGNIPQYRKLLREAATEYRRAKSLPPSLDPMFLALVSFCTSTAERVETRVEVFGSELKQRYLIPTGDRVFIIHGHDEAKWRELRDILEDKLDQKVIVLQEEPSEGETVIGKFEKLADDCCYAFALLTPDDFVEKEGKSYFQARPNVLLELGWFYGRFGRDRVCIVKKLKTEIPSDLAGILTINFHSDISEAFAKIEAELRRVGVIADARGLARRSGGRGKKRITSEV